jgi:hypothetical protein
MLELNKFHDFSHRLKIQLFKIAPETYDKQKYISKHLYGPAVDVLGEVT